MELSMMSPAPAVPASRKMLWAGRTLRALATLFLAFDGAVKLTSLAPVIEAHERLGIPLHLAPAIGLLELALLALYLVPRTAVLGAVLFTGFLGGATAIHVRSGTPYWFPIAMGALLWIGLVMVDERLRRFVTGRDA